MALEVKICGLRTPAAVKAAAAGGAARVGLVFYPPSPRCVDLSTARSLGELARGLGLVPVGVYVDPDDSLLAATAPAVDWLQLHGSETPARAAEVRDRFGKPVMKAIRIGKRAGLDAAAAFTDVADRLLFDSLPEGSVLPGGTGTAFDWSMMQGVDFGRPWMLSGGLDANCLAAAVAASGARAVDVSSGVEVAPGEKSVELIREFLERAHSVAVAEHIA